jgi:hypothetical protein
MSLISVEASTEVYLETNTEETKHMVVSRHQNSGKNLSDDKSFGKGQVFENSRN